ncbi:PilZ domain-containing protein [Thiorhodococcus mannitoliphagus]|uniref:PilZ domain-containing protein n=1 Tax=Thiorhodococcus mannitoliphagus TaxID=329406 RepID=A0A6P1DTL0_9GAMM|nr:PilZ domain-containing protein [Thiorhodococcus mannitoliphagus]NEX20026.1 PilZ domain-containing protein [Thiorhodococcus mannitoliphagus]
MTQTQRQFLRHPADVPISYSLRDVVDSQSDYLRDIGEGGLCFTSRIPISPGTSIHIEIPIAQPVFRADGVVVWCSAADRGFEVGVRFEGVEAEYSIRMVEQVCHIEHYRRQVLDQEGRSLTSEEAALEWIEQFAERFPR